MGKNTQRKFKNWEIIKNMDKDIIEYSSDIDEWSIKFISDMEEEYLMSYKDGLSNLDDLSELVTNMFSWKIKQIIFPKK